MQPERSFDTQGLLIRSIISLVSVCILYMILIRCGRPAPPRTAVQELVLPGVRCLVPRGTERQRQMRRRAASA